MAKSTVAVKFVGDVANLKKSLGDVDKSFGGMATGTKVAMAAAGAAVVGFAAKSASTFARVGGEVLKLQRFTGATAEEASRLRFAGKQAGLDVDVLTKSLGLLSKNVVGTKLDKLGLGLKDIRGKALPLNDELLKISARFEGMPNGAEKTALAMQLFGKSGAAMIPFLNRGAAGIAELEKQSDKFGNTLSGKDLAAVKDSTKQHRLFSAAMDGLQIQVGRYVLPVMTKFTTFLASNMPPAIEVVRKGMEALSPVFNAVGSVMSKVGEVVGSFFNAFQAGDSFGFTSKDGFLGQVLVMGAKARKVFDQIRDAWQVFKNAFSANDTFGLTGADGLDGKFAVVGKAVRGFVNVVRQNLHPILLGLGVAFGLLVSPIGVAIAAIVLAYQRFEGFRNVVAAVVDWLTGTAAPAIGQFAAYIAEQFGNLVGWVQENWAAIGEAISHVVNVVRDVIGAEIAVISALWQAWGDDLLRIVAQAWDTIRRVVEDAIGVVRGVIQTVVALINGDWGKAWEGLKTIVASAWDGIKSIISGSIEIIVHALGGMGSSIKAVAGGMFDAIKDAFRSAINWIIRAWNGLEFKIPGFDPPGPGPSFGGFTLGVPNIPALAEGGIVRARPGGTLALLGEAGRDEAVVPLGADGRTGPAIHIDHVTLGNGASVADLAAELLWMWRVAG